jgi:ubiquinone biosynthesis accessory factor UbiJ
MPSPIKLVIISILESALNRYLSLDEQADRLLGPLAGKVIAIHITPWMETLFLCPAENSIQILESYYGKIDAELTGSLFAFGWMGVSSTPLRALYKGDVILQGDTAVAHKFQSLFAKLDINLEKKISVYTGSRFAEGLSRQVTGWWGWSRQAILDFRHNVEEYLQDETRELPAKPEAELLFQAIDVCRSDYDRLQARIQRLAEALDAAKPETENQPELPS